MENYKYKILIVDDNAELVNLIAAILKEDGYRKVLTAGSMKEGMEIFRESRPDMAVLDIMLPDGDGFSMFAKMREESEIPILFLSAKDEDEDRLFGLGLGADDYITKPFLPKEPTISKMRRKRRSSGWESARCCLRGRPSGLTGRRHR